MTTEYLDLKMDFMFKQLFGHPSRKKITIAFLNDLLHRQGRDRITDVQYENTELIKAEQVGKTSRLDVLVYTSNDERINVEIQMVDQHDMPEQVLYYWSKLFSSSLQTGQYYSELVPAIMISILNYPLFPHETDSFHNVFHLYEDNEHFIWSPHLEFHTFDLSQFMVKWKKYRREMKAKPSAEYPWLMMLSAADYRKKTIDTNIFHELEEFAMNEQEVREAIKEWESLSANQENKVLYEARLKYLRDQLSNIMGERRAGREEGIKEGIQKEREAVIRKMLSNGTAPDTIADMLDYPLEEIKKIEWKIESSN
ncbi:Rpn family recombination-promoting nuclease/putative transposase [Heyndrickxia acidiproducens]|uniref:Rpn family recombination-promoting nuclease/putative transposase n=1 Tax=Heyndrickxia acidiproducens TaxID=1121084 RepID=UPI000380A74D|nr:Rpn family recombination-promoting nuclease/putative transposase [Heyndrickxia acidiproducens]